MPERSAVVVDLFPVTGAVHQVVQVADARRSHRPQRDRSWAVMQRRRRLDATHQDAPVGDVQVQLVAGPEGSMSPSVAFAAHVGLHRQVVQHLAQHHVLPLLQTARLPWTILALARPSPLAVRLRGMRRLRSRLLPRLDRSRIPRDVPNQMPSQCATHPCLMQPCRQRTSRKLRKSPRVRRFARHRTRRRPATMSPQPAVNREPLDQIPQGRQAEYRLRQKRMRLCNTILRGTARTTM